MIATLHRQLDTRHIPTWVPERLVAALVLGGVAAVGGTWQHALGALAVLAGFAHGQVADRLREAAEAAARGEARAVPCHRKERRYFVVKEALWAVYFIALGAWPALAGCTLFLAYPLWRQAWRRAE